MTPWVYCQNVVSGASKTRRAARFASDSPGPEAGGLAGGYMHLIIRAERQVRAPVHKTAMSLFLITSPKPPTAARPPAFQQAAAAANFSSLASKSLAIAPVPSSPNCARSEEGRSYANSPVPAAFS